MGLFDFFISRDSRNLSEAVMSGDITAVEKMLKAGADPNVIPSNDDSPPIFYALRKGTKMVQLLIDYGADIDRIGRRGVTPLAFALAYDLNEAAAVLQTAGACIRTGIYEEFNMDPVSKLLMEDHIRSLKREYHFQSDHPYEKKEEIADRIYYSLIQYFPFAQGTPSSFQKVVQQEMRILVLRELNMETKDENMKLLGILSEVMRNERNI